LAAPHGTQPAASFRLWVCCVGGIVISIIHTTNYWRSALLVYWDGLVFRNWFGRRRFIPWSDVQGIMVTYKVASGGSTGTDTPYVTLFLMLHRADGNIARLRISVARQWEQLYADLTSMLAQRANLEYLGRSEGQEVWRRKS